MIHAVHPHACGEHVTTSSSVCTVSGSSPRMWGTRGADDPHVRRLRFIPTHVGNTNRSPSPECRRAVHPHACGEHGWQRSSGLEVIGSSPRMWGTRRISRIDGFKYRFIPTHVGNTSLMRKRGTNHTVHPHACGEHTAAPDLTDAEIGSSPRMWGTPDRCSSARRPGRFIPTHVGNT